MRKTEMQARALHEWGTLHNGSPRMVILHHYRGQEWLARHTSHNGTDQDYLVRPSSYGGGCSVQEVPVPTPRPKRRSTAAEVVEAYIPESKLFAGYAEGGILHIHTAECELLKDADSPAFVIEEFDNPQEMARCWFEELTPVRSNVYVQSHTVVEPCVA